MPPIPNPNSISLNGKLIRHWENGNVLRWGFVVFTFVLFFMDFPFNIKDNFLNIINRIFFPYYLFLKARFPQEHLLYYRLTALVLLVIGLIAGFFLWKIIRKINIEQRVVQLIGIKETDAYPKALFKSFIAAMLVLAVASILYYTARFFITDDVIFDAIQFWISYLVILILIFQTYCTLYIGRSRIIPFTKDYFTTPTSAYNLAIFRVVIGLYLFGFYHYRTFTTAYWATMPHESRVSLPMMGWFIQNVPINPELYFAVGIFGMVLAWFIAFGLFTRPALLINIPISIYLLGVPMFFGKLAHQQIWVWFPAILAFSRCADVFSLDAIIRKRIHKQTITNIVSPIYSLPFKFVWLHFGIIYFFAGIVKLRDCGLEWALGKNMINQIQIEWLQNYDMLPTIRIDHYPIFAHLSGMGLIMFELFYPFLVLTPLTRLISFWGGLSFHQSAQYFMNIGFQDLQQTYVSYINFAGIGNRVKAMINKTTVPTPHPEVQPNKVNSDFWNIPDVKKVMITGTLLYSINFFFSLTSTHSWPFSSYPTYSRLVPDKHWYVYFEAYDQQKNPLDIYELGKQAGHRMESYTPIEDRIYENYFAKDTATLNQNITRLWTIWKDNVPTLQQADSVVVYLQQSPIAPEKKDTILQRIRLKTID